MNRRDDEMISSVSLHREILRCIYDNGYRGDRMTNYFDLESNQEYLYLVVFKRDDGMNHFRTRQRAIDYAKATGGRVLQILALVVYEGS